MKDWDDLKYILAIYRHGGLSAAARSLDVNHATVSRRLAALEDRLSVRLFERFANGMTTTIHGQRAVEAALEIEKHILDLDLTIAAKDRDLSGPLKIAAPQLILQYTLSDILKEFVESYPQIDLSVIATNDTVNLHRREADVSIRVSNEPAENQWGKKVLTQNCAYYGSRDYLNNRPNNQPLSCINFHWHGDEPAPEISHSYANAKVVVKYDDMVAVLGAVKAGIGVARMPCFIGDQEETFQRLANVDKEPYTDIWALTHPDLRKTTRIKTFMSFVSNALQNKRSLFEGR